MSLENTVRGICLGSPEIRQLLTERRILSSLIDESRIQPSSFEPIIGDEVFILDTEGRGIFRPNTRETIYTTLLRIPRRERLHATITDGFELKKGYTYLLPLEEQLQLQSNEFVIASPKSSIGRIFLHTRLMADYHACFDSVNGHAELTDPLRLWLLVQPLAFNVLVHPGISLNQLRFFRGRGALLRPDELAHDFLQQPLLYSKDRQPLEPDIQDDGVVISIDLEGKTSGGIVGLRARHHPHPLDLHQKAAYATELFFEPLKAPQGQIILRPHEHYLFASREVLHVPADHNVELSSHSDAAFQGSLHFAGFADNGFHGDLVLEVRSDEPSPMVLEDGMPISVLRVYRTTLPDKLYGTATQAHYQEQTGPKVAKYFQPLDWSFLSRQYQKLERRVLVLEASLLHRFRSQKEGLEFLPDGGATILRQTIEYHGFFHSRYDCEEDPLLLQPIPYVLLFGKNATVFTYQRAAQRHSYGEERLFGKYSLGVGGHIIASDAPHYLEQCIQREVFGEEVTLDTITHGPHFVGTLFENDRPVDAVHFGLIYTLFTDGPISPRESSILHGSLRSFTSLQDDVAEHPEQYETWTRVLIPHLHTLYQHP